MEYSGISPNQSDKIVEDHVENTCLWIDVGITSYKKHLFDNFFEAK